MTLFDQVQEDLRRKLEALGYEVGPKGGTRVHLTLEEPPTEEDPDDARIINDFFGFPVLVDENQEEPVRLVNRRRCFILPKEEP